MTNQQQSIGFNTKLIPVDVYVKSADVNRNGHQSKADQERPMPNHKEPIETNPNPNKYVEIRAKSNTSIDIVAKSQYINENQCSERFLLSFLCFCPPACQATPPDGCCHPATIRGRCAGQRCPGFSLDDPQTARYEQKKFLLLLPRSLPSDDARRMLPSGNHPPEMCWPALPRI